MNEAALKGFESFWGTEKHCYTLEEIDASAPDFADRYIVVDLRGNCMVIIESRAIKAEVVRRMLDAGVLVGGRFDPKIRKAFMRARLKGACSDKS
ncbi:hypothetical protein [Sorangium sp. So ce394]|uniref:hypothetical protein n=1 Tax=Sorangium sp. So ce394 TaxID=3133310 RepID=UPI003F5C2DE8